MVNLSALVPTNLGQQTTVQSTVTCVQVSAKWKRFFYLLISWLFLYLILWSFLLLALAKHLTKEKKLFKKDFKVIFETQVIMGSLYTFIWLEVFGIYCRLFYTKTGTLFDDSVDLYQIAGEKIANAKLLL